MLPLLLTLTLAWGAFAFGAVYPWAYTPLGIACVVIAALGFVRRPPPSSSPVNLTLLAGFAVIALAVGVQLVPVSGSLRARLSPATDEFLRRADLQYVAMLHVEQVRHGTDAANPASDSRAPAANPAGADAHPDLPHPLSIDPDQTWLGLGLMAAFAVFVLGLARGLGARDARRLAPALVGVGVALALAGIVQLADRSGKIYGFWVPETGLHPFSSRGGTFGPFVNRNHFAGWMLMAVPVTLGYFIARLGRCMRGVEPDWYHRFRWLSSAEANRIILLGAAILLMALSLVLTLSRSGMSCFALALTLSAVVVTRRHARGWRRLLVIGYLVLLATVAGLWVGFDAIGERFQRADADFPERLSAWNDALHIHHDFPMFGTGLNTFGTAMVVYQTADFTGHFNETHNDYLQLLSEGGLVVVIPAFVLLILFIREVRRRFRDDTDDEMTYWIRVGAVTGLVAIGLQEIVEFSLQMPGNTALFCTLMAIAAAKLPHRGTVRRRTAEA